MSRIPDEGAPPPHSGLIRFSACACVWVWEGVCTQLQVFQGCTCYLLKANRPVQTRSGTLYTCKITLMLKSAFAQPKKKQTNVTACNFKVQLKWNCMFFSSAAVCHACFPARLQWMLWMNAASSYECWRRHANMLTLTIFNMSMFSR